MLTQVVSLWWQVLLYIVGRVEDFSPEALSLLPTYLRRWLFLHLPVADVCLLEGTSMSNGLDMEQIWEELYKARLVVVKQNNIGRLTKFSWKEQYCYDLWMCMFDHITPSLVDNSTRSVRQWIVRRRMAARRSRRSTIQSWNRCSSSLKHMLLTRFFGTSIELVQNIQKFKNTQIFSISQVTCDKCVHVMICPQRYLHHCKNLNFLKITSFFWIYFHYKPDYIRLSVNGLSTACSDLSKIILISHPDILSTPFSEMNSLDIQPVSDNSSEVLKTVITSVSIPLKVLKINLSSNTNLENLYPLKSIEKLVLYGLKNTGISFRRFRRSTLSINHVDSQNISIHPLLSNNLTHLSICRCSEWNNLFSQLPALLFNLPNFRNFSMLDMTLSGQTFNEILSVFVSSPLPLTLEYENCTIIEDFDESQPKLLGIRVFEDLHDSSLLEKPNALSTTVIEDLHDRSSLEQPNALEELPEINNCPKSLVLRLQSHETILSTLRKLETLPLQSLIIGNDLFKEVAFLKRINVQVLHVECVINDSSLMSLPTVLALQGVSQIKLTYLLNGRHTGYIFSDYSKEGDELVQQFNSILHFHHNLCSLVFDCGGLNSINEQMLSILLEGVMTLSYLSDLTLDFKNLGKREQCHVRPVYDAWMKCAGGKKMKRICFKEVIDLSMDELTEIAQDIEGYVGKSDDSIAEDMAVDFKDQPH